MIIFSEYLVTIKKEEWMRVPYLRREEIKEMLENNYGVNVKYLLDLEKE